MPLILRPHLRLRKEPYGVILFSDDPFEAEGWHLTTIPPAVALVMSTFDGYKEVDEINRFVAYIFKTPLKQAERFVERILKELHFCFTTYNASLRDLYPAYDPKEFAYRSVSLTSGEKARPTAPLSLVYVVTESCNRRCQYCYADASPDKNTVLKDRYLSLDRLQELFEEAGRLGVATVVFSGGEPFLRSDIVDIIGFVIQNGIFPWVSTKAGLSPSIVRKLSNAGLRRIQVSIDSLDPKIADRLTGSKGYFQEIIETIKLLMAQGIEVQTNTVVTSINIAQIPALIDYLVTLGIRDICLTPYARSLGRHKDELFTSYDDLKGLLTLTKQYEDNKRVIVRYAGDLVLKMQKPREESFIQRLFCSAGRLGVVILPDGKVTICERLQSTPQAIVGDVTEQSLTEVWNSKPIQELAYPQKEKYEGTECYTCTEYEECTNSRGRCFVRSLLTHETIFGPDPLCPRAPLSASRLI